MANKILNFEKEEKGYKSFSINPQSVKDNKGKMICYVDFVEPYRGTYFVRYGKLYSLKKGILFLDDGEREVSVRKIKECGIKIDAE